MMLANFGISASDSLSPPPAGARLLLVPALALLGMAAAAAAQPSQPECPAARLDDGLVINPGNCHRSSLDAQDPKNEDQMPTEDWRAYLVAGERVRIDMDAIPTSSDRYGFDTYLEVSGPRLPEVLTNDDRPGSTNSTISFTAPDSGLYTIRASPLVDQRGGPYTLRVSRTDAIVIGPSFPGQLEIPIERFAGSPGGPTILVSRLFVFNAVPRERVRFVAAASTPGGVLMTLSEDGRRVVNSSNSAGTEGALVAFLLRGGAYQLEVRVPAGPQPGRLTLTMERRPHAADQLPMPIAVGESLDAALSLESDVTGDPYGAGANYMFNEYYELQLRPGEPVTATLESPDFDPVLDAGAMSPLGFAAVVSDNDSGPGSSARLVLRPVRVGPVLLRVRAPGSQLGRFRISVTAGETALPAAD